MSASKTGRRKKQSEALKRNWLLIVLSVLVVASIDAFSATIILKTNSIVLDVGNKVLPASAFEIFTLFGCGLVALYASSVIAELKHDPRPSQQMRAPVARAVMIAVLLPCIASSGKAWTYADRSGAHMEYHGTKQEELDAACLASVADCGEDNVAAAQERFKASVEPKHAIIDPAWLVWAAIIYGAVILAMEAFWKHAPETDAQANRRREQEDRIAMEQKEAEEKAAQEKAERAARGWFGNVFDWKSRKSA